MTIDYRLSAAAPAVLNRPAGKVEEDAEKMVRQVLEGASGVREVEGGGEPDEQAWDSVEIPWQLVGSLLAFVTAAVVGVVELISTTAGLDAFLPFLIALALFLSGLLLVTLNLMLLSMWYNQNVRMNSGTASTRAAVSTR